MGVDVIDGLPARAFHEEADGYADEDEAEDAEDLEENHG
jgi:hypothetical protein